MSTEEWGIAVYAGVLGFLYWVAGRRVLQFPTRRTLMALLVWLSLYVGLRFRLFSGLHEGSVFVFLIAGFALIMLLHVSESAYSVLISDGQSGKKERFRVQSIFVGLWFLATGGLLLFVV